MGKERLSKVTVEIPTTEPTLFATVKFPNLGNVLTLANVCALISTGKFPEAIPGLTGMFCTGSEGTIGVSVLITFKFT